MLHVCPMHKHEVSVNHVTLLCNCVTPTTLKRSPLRNDDKPIQKPQTMKRIQYLMLVLGATLFLAACSTKTETPTPAATSEPAATPAAKEKVKIDVDGNKVGVEYEKQK